MLVKTFSLVLLLKLFQVSHCTRRIEGGQIVISNKTYMVYLVKATLSVRNYDYWICGGALVTEDFILTSAACVEDVNFLFAIAGYDKYVPDSEINDNECTKKMKKRVIFTCVPVSYQFDFHKLEKWAHIDIALAKVDSPYDFSDESFTKLCSYTPTIIPINYDPKYQLPDTDALVMGWGHAKIWRKHHDQSNYNTKVLHYASTLIMNKEDCKKYYDAYPQMYPIIDQYMICTLESGNIDDTGIPIVKSDLQDGCDPKQDKLSGTKGIYCPQYDYGYVPPISQDETRRELKENKTIYNYTTNDYIKRSVERKKSQQYNGRKNGICQNDHGGPLVTWVGKREVLIGIASVFQVSEESECIGPYLYTSTQCNGAFLNCVLNTGTPYRRAKNSAS